MNLRRLYTALGPGILLAATSVGVSHLVLSPQAGALFGYQLLWLVVAAHVLKYPAFEFGPRYAAATGRNLLEGYARIRGPRNWALWVFMVSTVVQGVGVLAGVVSVAGCVLRTWTGLLDTPWCAVLLTWAIVGLLLAGGFSWLDHLNKLMMAALAVATVLAFVPIVPGPEAWTHLVIPAIPAGSIVLVAAILSWMPTGIDVSVWHSFWTLEKLKRLDRGEGAGDEGTSDALRRRHLRTSLADMRIGYGLSLATGLMFLTMGAVHLAGRGAELEGVGFAQALSLAYTTILGRWMVHVFMLTAFFAMFSTSYTVIDGFSRSFAECSAVLWPAASAAAPPVHKRLYTGFVIGSAVLACGFLLWIGNPVTLATAAALVSLAAAPLLYGFNLVSVVRDVREPGLRPSRLNVGLGCAGTVLMLLALGMMLYVKVVR